MYRTGLPNREAGGRKSRQGSYSLDLLKAIYLSIDDNKAKARERIGPFLKGFYRGRYDVDSWCAFGPPADCAAFIKRFLDSGFTTMMLCLVPPDAEHLERSHR